MATITGRITVNGKQILEVDANPAAGGGTPAPIGSLAMFDSGTIGTLYLKVGAADTAWEDMESANAWQLAGNTLSGGSPTTPNEFFGSTNDYDNIFRRNNIEQMRMIASDAALLIGLSASIGGRLQVNRNTQGENVIAQVLSAAANPVIFVTRMFRVTTVGATTATWDTAVPASSNILLTTNCCARQTAGATGAVGDGAAYIRTLRAQNQGGTVQFFQEQNDYTYEIAGGLDITPSVSGTNIRFTASGVTNRNLTWGVYSELLITGT